MVWDLIHCGGVSGLGSPYIYPFEDPFEAGNFNPLHLPSSKGSPPVLHFIGMAVPPVDLALEAYYM